MNLFPSTMSSKFRETMQLETLSLVLLKTPSEFLNPHVHVVSSVIITLGGGFGLAGVVLS